MSLRARLRTQKRTEPGMNLHHRNTRSASCQIPRFKFSTGSKQPPAKQSSANNARLGLKQSRKLISEAGAPPGPGAPLSVSSLTLADPGDQGAETAYLTLFRGPRCGPNGASATGSNLPLLPPGLDAIILTVLCLTGSGPVLPAQRSIPPPRLPGS